MRPLPTLSTYLARHFGFWLAAVFLALAAIVAVFDLVELLRRSADKTEVGLDIVLQMSLLKLPHLVEKMLPFSVLIGTMLAFWRLSRANELIVARASGVSVWQFLAPAVAIAMLIGVAQVTVFNPLASVLLTKFESLESRHLKRSTSILTLSKTGLWLRQADNAGQSVIHALWVSQQEVTLHEVIIFLFQGKDTFIGRIDAESAQLKPGHWDIRNAWISAPNRSAEFVAEHRLDTDLTLDKILDSFASPETMSFWELPDFIASLERAGFSGHRHKLYWHTLLATPFLLGSMVLIAAVFTSRMTRRTRVGAALAGVVLTGFLLYFLTDVIYALGLSANLPVLLAAWTPAGVAILLGLSLLFHLEDG